MRRLVSIVSIATALLTAMPAAAQEPQPASDGDDAAVELAERHTPIIALKAQDDACDPDGEPYGPAQVDIVLDNREVVLRQLGTGNPVVQRAPEAADLHGLGEGFYLDFPGDALDPGCLYETDFRRFTEQYPPTVYAHVVQQDDHPDLLALQYWIYWYYNDWNNKHESDWEGIQLLFEASTVEEALAGEPVSIGYAQHEGGERANWDAAKLERDGTRPVVYSSAGSHASYFSSAYYLGRSGSEGFGCDTTEGPSDVVDPEVVVLPDEVTDPASPLAWLDFAGRWGERQNGPFNGPTGPAAKDRWLEPVTWHDDLRTSSVIIPGGGLANTVTEAFCDVVERGSGALITYTNSPLRLLLTAVVAVVVGRWLAGRTVWTPGPATPVRRRRRAGEIIRAAASLYRREPLELLPFGLVFGPAAVVVALFGALVAILPLVGDLLGLAGDGGTSLALALLAGSVPTVAGIVVVNALVASHLGGRESGRDPSVTETMGRVWARRGPLAGGFVRAFAIVYVLLITVIGIPWAIRQLVRYQFLAQAVILDGSDGRAALGRSTELVRGRWWHTALLTGIFNGLVLIATIGLGLVLLLVLAGLPMWAFSAATLFGAAVLVPGTSVAQVLLYGDAVAEHEKVPAAAPDSVDA